MIDDVWPLFALSIRTSRLVLRLPREDELPALAAVAAGGVHAPDERPFLTPWTEGGPEARARSVLQDHWGSLGEWQVDSWWLGLAVLVDDEPVGRVALRADDYPVVREVRTSSWLGLAHQGRGLGTEARAGALALAFDHLGAQAALTEVFRDNHASQGVSRKLGYRPDGISRDRRDDEVLVSDRLRLTAQDWSTSSWGKEVEVSGVERCRAEFGIRAVAAHDD